MTRERHSLGATGTDQRRGSVWGVFFIWLAATMTASTIPLGGIMAQMFPGAPFLPVILAASGFFLLVGIISIPGFVYGLPTMVVSEHLFGARVNRLISAANWLSQVGWESVVLVIVIYIVRSLLFPGDTVYPLSATLTALVVSLFANFTVPLLGYRAIVVSQKAGAIVLMVFSVVIFLHIPARNSLILGHTVMSGTTLRDALGALSLGLMGGALSWTMFSSDYSRFMRPGTSLARVAMAPAIGGFLGNFVILLVSVALYQAGGVAFGKDGIAFPRGMFHSEFLYYGFCIFAVIGLLASNFLNAFSSAFSLAVMLRRDLNRRLSTFVDASIGTAIAVWILFYAPTFLDVFEVFLSLIIIVAAPWTGVVAVEILADRIGGGLPADPASWLAGRRRRTVVMAVAVAASALFSSNPLWTGYGAQALGGVDISPLVGLILAALLTGAARLVRGAGAQDGLDPANAGAQALQGPSR
ncbi:cytosine permease [Acidiferrobacter sp.]|uniref:purine-cytosine permease family protein n=1 Tax=Acidiferrobacter sp. TaxID=1872107 RepID=UPI00262D406C|nr:cytosine permease [Acidiferrobacter sp.]